MPDHHGQAVDLDDDDRDPYPPPWHAGRPAPRTRGPVIEAYVDTDALEVDCATSCGAAVGDFCHHPDGTQRKMPCPKRITRAAAHQARTKGASA